jgi:hypothetical protein
MKDSIWTKILLDWEWVYFPFNKIMIFIFPYEMGELSSGYIALSRGFLYNPIRDFLNVAVYVGVGMGVGMVRKRVKNE